MLDVISVVAEQRFRFAVPDVAQQMRDVLLPFVQLLWKRQINNNLITVIALFRGGNLITIGHWFRMIKPYG